MKRAWLIGRSGIYANAKIELEGQLLIGRDSQVCQLVYPDSAKKISGVHCRVQNMNGTFCITDMNSTNGTFFQDGTRLEPNMPRTLMDGQGFYLSSRENFFDIHIEEAEKKRWGIGNVAEGQREMAQQNVQSQQQPQIIYQKSSGAGKVIATICIVVLLGIVGVLGYNYYMEENKSTTDKFIDAGESFIDDLDDLGW